jgi:hypothetical protein
MMLGLVAAGQAKLEDSLPIPVPKPGVPDGIGSKPDPLWAAWYNAAHDPGRTTD